MQNKKTKSSANRLLIINSLNSTIKRQRHSIKKKFQFYVAYKK